MFRARVFLRSFISSPRSKMPITELVFPAFKTDAESVAAFKTQAQDIFQSLSNIEGLQAGFQGPILEENGSPVDPKSMRSILVLDWQNAGSFHAFYPKSEQFASFIGKVKPFAAGPAVPELYEQPQERSIACTSSAVTQVIKVKASAGASDGVGGSSKDTEDAWAQLVAAIKASTTTTTGAKFYHANGIEKDKDTFLGLIGWSNLQEYERVGKSSAVLERVKALNTSSQGQVVNMAVRLSRI